MPHKETALPLRVQIGAHDVVSDQRKPGFDHMASGLSLVGRWLIWATRNSRG